jgi:hypothetical protein
LYAAFEENFGSSPRWEEDYGDQGVPGFRIKRVLAVDFVAMDLMLCLWAAIVGGLVSFRRESGEPGASGDGRGK